MLIIQNKLPKDVDLQKHNTLFSNTNITEHFEIKEKVIMKNIALPEFSNSIKIDEVEAFVFHSNNQTTFDMIIEYDWNRCKGFSNLK